MWLFYEFPFTNFLSLGEETFKTIINLTKSNFHTSSTIMLQFLHFFRAFSVDVLWTSSRTLDWLDHKGSRLLRSRWCRCWRYWSSWWASRREFSRLFSWRWSWRRFCDEVNVIVKGDALWRSHSLDRHVLNELERWLERILWTFYPLVVDSGNEQVERQAI